MGNAPRLTALSLHHQKFNSSQQSRVLTVAGLGGEHTVGGFLRSRMRGSVQPDKPAISGRFGVQRPVTGTTVQGENGRLGFSGISSLWVDMSIMRFRIAMTAFREDGWWNIELQRRRRESQSNLKVSLKTKEWMKPHDLPPIQSEMRGAMSLSAGNNPFCL